MSTKKYIELNSKFRNRKLYPNPADFQVFMSNSGMRNQSNALDPISKSYPINEFFGWDPISCTVPTYNLAHATIGNISTSTAFVIYTLNTTSIVDDYYVGCTIVDTNNLARRIIGIKYLYTDGNDNYFQVITDLPYVPFDTSGKILNGSDFSGTDNYYLFIPSSMSLANYLTGYIIYNRTQIEYATITAYDNITHLAQFKKPTYTWSTTDWFYIAQAPPSIYGINPYTGSVASLRRITSGSGYGSQGFNVSTTNTTALGVDTHITVQWEGSIDGKLPENLIINFGGYDDTSISSSNNLGDSILITGAGNEDATYTIDALYPKNGSIVVNFKVDETYINSFVGVSYNNIYNIYRIIGIDSGNVLLLDDINFSYPSTTLSAIFLEFYPYTTDNVSPLIYTGSAISQTQASAHDIALISLTLPNQILNPGTNAYVYPFIYVELENVCTSSVNAKNLIYSNNPNVYKAVFRVEISELYNPQSLLFIRCNALSMPQMILFKQNTDLRISIKLPNGEVFQTKIQDTVNGAPPNDFLQISAIFSVEKI